MQFLVYLVAVLVSVGGILVELDWLTKPKLETKSPVQVATAVVPPRAVPKIAGPTEGPSPIYSAKREAEKTNDAPAAAETTGAAAAEPVTEPPVPAVAQAKVEPQPAAPVESAPQLRPQIAPAPPTPAPVQAAAVQAPNSCDVQGCASAYQSFRASDCTYQPMQGPRKICSAPPAASQRLAATPPRDQTPRKPSRDAELRDVERVVRHITAGETADPDMDPRMGRSEVILIQRPDRDW